MNKDKKLYRHIYNFVKLREMNLPSAYEYQEKYGLNFIEEDIEEAFFRGGIAYGLKGIASGKGYNSILLYLFFVGYLILELYGLVPDSMAGKIVMMIISATVYYIVDYSIDYFSCRIKADYLYRVHMNSLDGGQRDDRY